MAARQVEVSHDTFGLDCLNGAWQIHHYRGGKSVAVVAKTLEPRFAYGFLSSGQSNLNDQI